MSDFDSMVNAFACNDVVMDRVAKAVGEAHFDERHSMRTIPFCMWSGHPAPDSTQRHWLVFMNFQYDPRWYALDAKAILSTLSEELRNGVEHHETIPAGKPPKVSTSTKFRPWTYIFEEDIKRLDLEVLEDSMVQAFCKQALLMDAPNRWRAQRRATVERANDAKFSQVLGAEIETPSRPNKTALLRDEIPLTKQLFGSNRSFSMFA